MRDYKFEYLDEALKRADKMVKGIQAELETAVYWQNIARKEKLQHLTARAANAHTDQLIEG